MLAVIGSTIVINLPGDRFASVEAQIPNVAAGDAEFFAGRWPRRIQLRPLLPAERTICEDFFLGHQKPAGLRMIVRDPAAGAELRAVVPVPISFRANTAGNVQHVVRLLEDQMGFVGAEFRRALYGWPDRVEDVRAQFEMYSKPL